MTTAQQGGRDATATTAFWTMTRFLVCVVMVLSVTSWASPAVKAVENSAASSAETYREVPDGRSFEARRKEYLEFLAAQPGGGPYVQAVHVAMGVAPNEDELNRALDTIAARHDCADFAMHGILRVVYQFGDSVLLSDAFRARAQKVILEFKYWPDEPGVDSMCSWSENHFILFASAGYLAGQRFPDATFVNSGQTGREKMAVCRPRILRWLDLRYRTGFSEWLSNCYYEEDLAALMSLVDFCADEEIRQRATIVVDLVLADMALNSFHGAFGSTHGRTYERQKKWPDKESTDAIARLMFGMNAFRVGNMAAIALALSPHYRMPQVLEDIATDLDRPETINEQRMGIRIKEAGRWGLDTHRLEDGMTFLTLEAYSHPRTVNLFARMLDAYDWWDNSFFAPFKKHETLIKTAHRCGLLPLMVWLFRHDVQRNTREEVNIYTYRTPDYMLSAAQDYRKGFGGDQQHIWQATLGPETTVFTTHPSSYSGKSPSYWVGSGTLPRVAQIKNVAIAVYRISKRPTLYVPNGFMFTHAWFPKDRFDEVVERDGWVMGRRGDGFVALWSREPCHWQDKEGEDRDRELIAPGRENVWICEMGRRAVDGDFASFVDKVAKARIDCKGLRVTYESPSQGTLEFGWIGALRQNGSPVTISDYPRYGNPYAQALFPSDVLRFDCNGDSLALDWNALTREVSAPR